MNIGDKVVMGLPRNFGPFLGTRSIFNPPHVWDLVDMQIAFTLNNLALHPLMPST